MHSLQSHSLIKLTLTARTVAACLITTTLLSSPSAMAKVTKQEAEQLGTSLTPMGATIEPNSDGSIPAWTGSMRGTPAGMTYNGSGDSYPDPYAEEKVLLTITAENHKTYADKLSDGQLALFAKYPDSYKIPVYPSHRDARYSEQVEKRTKWNATNAELVGGIDGLQHFTGGAPFPIPKSGAEVLWNARLNQPIPISDTLFDEIAVFSNGKMETRRLHSLFETPYAYTERPIGDVDIGPNAGLVFSKIVAPAREKGKMAIVHEPLDYVRYKRNSWILLPGTNRVRRAPLVGFDTLDGPGSFKTIDESLGFNGSMERYEWNLVGKKEMYIPYHAYRFDTPELNYETLLTPKHANPDYMRYELHRVWVVEATLKKGMRHLYAKRRFYIDEDNWLIVMTENYDSRGELWRIGILNTLYDYYLKGYISRVHMNHDMQASAYVATRLVNNTRPTKFNTKPKGKRFFTPKNLRKMGR